MKKSYLMIAAAVALFTACAEKDTFKDVDTQDVAIGFTNYVGKTTKGEITTSNITDYEFGVYGWKYKEGAPSTKPSIQLFDNERVYYANQDWKNKTVRYWDKSVICADLTDANDFNGYYFYAYTPYVSGDNTVSFTRTANNAATGFTYNLGTQVFADASESATVDLCVARAENISYENSNTYDASITVHNTAHVAFIFNHVLSKLAFKVKKEGFHEKAESTDDPTHTVELKEIKIAFPTATNVKWTQTSKSADNGSISYDNSSNTSTLVQPIANSNPAPTYTTVYPTGNYTGQAVENTAAVISGAKEYIVTPNILPAGQDNSQKHKMLLEVKYEINYHDDATNPTIDEQTATGEVEINFVENCFYYLVVNIKPVKIEFDVDRIEGFTPADDVIANVQ